MLLTLQGLPPDIQLKHIRLFIERQCGIRDFTLDGLTDMETCYSKQATLRVDDNLAAKVMEQLLGLTIGKYCLSVVPASKDKVAVSSQRPVTPPPPVISIGTPPKKQTSPCRQEKLPSVRDSRVSKAFCRLDRRSSPRRRSQSPHKSDKTCYVFTRSRFSGYRTNDRLSSSKHRDRSPYRRRKSPDRRSSRDRHRSSSNRCSSSSEKSHRHERSNLKRQRSRSPPKSRRTSRSPPSESKIQKFLEDIMEIDFEDGLEKSPLKAKTLNAQLQPVFPKITQEASAKALMTQVATSRTDILPTETRFPPSLTNTIPCETYIAPTPYISLPQIETTVPSTEINDSALQTNPVSGSNIQASKLNISPNNTNILTTQTITSAPKLSSMVTHLKTQSSKAKVPLIQINITPPQFNITPTHSNIPSSQKNIPRLQTTLPQDPPPRTPQLGTSQSIPHKVETHTMLPHYQTVMPPKKPILIPPSKCMSQRVPQHTMLPQAAPENTMIPQPVLQQTMIPQPALQQTMIPQPPVLQQTMIPEPVLQQTMIPEPVFQQTIIPQPVLQQTMIPEPVLQQTMIPQPVLQQTMIPQPVLQQTMVPQEGFQERMMMYGVTSQFSNNQIMQTTGTTITDYNTAANQTQTGDIWNHLVSLGSQVIANPSQEGALNIFQNMVLIASQGMCPQDMQYGAFPQNMMIYGGTPHENNPPLEIKTTVSPWETCQTTMPQASVTTTKLPIWDTVPVMHQYSTPKITHRKQKPFEAKCVFPPRIRGKWLKDGLQILTNEVLVNSGEKIQPNIRRSKDYIYLKKIIQSEIKAILHKMVKFENPQNMQEIISMYRAEFSKTNDKQYLKDVATRHFIKLPISANSNTMMTNTMRKREMDRRRFVANRISVETFRCSEATIYLNGSNQLLFRLIRGKIKDRINCMLLGVVGVSEEHLVMLYREIHKRTDDRKLLNQTLAEMKRDRIPYTGMYMHGLPQSYDAFVTDDSGIAPKVPRNTPVQKIFLRLNGDVYEKVQEGSPGKVYEVDLEMSYQQEGNTVEKSQKNLLGINNKQIIMTKSGTSKSVATKSDISMSISAENAISESITDTIGPPSSKATFKMQIEPSKLVSKTSWPQQTEEPQLYNPDKYRTNLAVVPIENEPQLNMSDKDRTNLAVFPIENEPQLNIFDKDKTNMAVVPIENEPQLNMSDKDRTNLAVVPIENEPQLNMSGKDRTNLAVVPIQNERHLNMSDKDRTILAVVAIENKPQLNMSDKDRTNLPVVPIKNESQLNMSDKDRTNQPVVPIENEPQLNMSDKDRTNLAVVPIENEPQLNMSDKDRTNLAVVPIENEPQLNMFDKDGTNMAVVPIENEPQLNMSDKDGTNMAVVPIENEPQLNMSDKDRTNLAVVPIENEPQLNMSDKDRNNLPVVPIENEPQLNMSDKDRTNLVVVPIEKEPQLIMSDKDRTNLAVVPIKNEPELNMPDKDRTNLAVVPTENEPQLNMSDKDRNNLLVVPIENEPQLNMSDKDRTNLAVVPIENEPQLNMSGKDKTNMAVVPIENEPQLNMSDKDRTNLAVIPIENEAQLNMSGKDRTNLAVVPIENEPQRNMPDKDRTNLAVVPTENEPQLNMSDMDRNNLLVVPIENEPQLNMSDKDRTNLAVVPIENEPQLNMSGKDKTNMAVVPIENEPQLNMSDKDRTNLAVIPIENEPQLNMSGKDRTNLAVVPIENEPQRNMSDKDRTNLAVVPIENEPQLNMSDKDRRNLAVVPIENEPQLNMSDQDRTNLAVVPIKNEPQLNMSDKDRTNLAVVPIENEPQPNIFDKDRTNMAVVSIENEPQLDMSESIMDIIGPSSSGATFNMQIEPSQLISKTSWPQQTEEPQLYMSDKHRTNLVVVPIQNERHLNMSDKDRTILAVVPIENEPQLNMSDKDRTNLAVVPIENEPQLNMSDKDRTKLTVVPIENEPQLNMSDKDRTNLAVFPIENEPQLNIFDKDKTNMAVVPIENEPQLNIFDKDRTNMAVVPIENEPQLNIFDKDRTNMAVVLIENEPQLNTFDKDGTNMAVVSIENEPQLDMSQSIMDIIGPSSSGATFNMQIEPSQLISKTSWLQQTEEPQLYMSDKHRTNLVAVPIQNKRHLNMSDKDRTKLAVLPIENEPQLDISDKDRTNLAVVSIENESQLDMSDKNWTNLAVAPIENKPQLIMSDKDRPNLVAVPIKMFTTETLDLGKTKMLQGCPQQKYKLWPNMSKDDMAKLVIWPAEDFETPIMLRVGKIPSVASITEERSCLPVINQSSLKEPLMCVIDKWKLICTCYLACDVMFNGGEQILCTKSQSNDYLKVLNGVMEAVDDRLIRLLKSYTPESPDDYFKMYRQQYDEATDRELLMSVAGELNIGLPLANRGLYIKPSMVGREHVKIKTPAAAHMYYLIEEKWRRDFFAEVLALDIHSRGRIGFIIALDKDEQTLARHIKVHVKKRIDRMLGTLAGVSNSDILLLYREIFKRTDDRKFLRKCLEELRESGVAYHGIYSKDVPDEIPEECTRNLQPEHRHNREPLLDNQVVRSIRKVSLVIRGDVCAIVPDSTPGQIFTIYLLPLHTTSFERSLTTYQEKMISKNMTIKVVMPKNMKKKIRRMLAKNMDEAVAEVQENKYDPINENQWNKMDAGEDNKLYKSEKKQLEDIGSEICNENNIKAESEGVKEEFQTNLQKKNNTSQNMVRSELADALLELEGTCTGELIVESLENNTHPESKIDQRRNQVIEIIQGIDLASEGPKQIIELTDKNNEIQKKGKPRWRKMLRNIDLASEGQKQITELPVKNNEIQKKRKPRWRKLLLKY